jgi:hypothetical protein
LIEDAVQVKPIVGRGSRRRPAAIPEEAELFRTDPELPQLIDESSSIEPGEAAQSC